MSTTFTDTPGPYGTAKAKDNVVGSYLINIQSNSFQLKQ